MSKNPNLPSKITVIVLGVSDLAKSIAFYRDTLGIEFKGQHEDLAFFQLDTIMLMLNGELRRGEGPLAGATEIVCSVESVAASHELLTERGCNFVRPPRQLTPDSWGAVLADPDGHYLTVFGPK